jgi:hypothetical protein
MIAAQRGQLRPLVHRLGAAYCFGGIGWSEQIVIERLSSGVPLDKVPQVTVFATMDHG